MKKLKCTRTVWRGNDIYASFTKGKIYNTVSNYPYNRIAEAVLINDQGHPQYLGAWGKVFIPFRLKDILKNL